MVGTAVLSGLNTAYTIRGQVEDQSSTATIARHQLEDIFSQSFLSVGQGAYSTISPPTGYAVSVATEHVDSNAPDPDIERVIVTVNRDGQAVLILPAIRFNA